VLTYLEVTGFKSFEKISLGLGNLNLFVGTNASGKSNFFDALRVLQGIGYGFTIEELLNGKPKSSTSDVWEPIRGGSARAQFLGHSVENLPVDERIVRFDVSIKPSKDSHELLNYHIGFSPLTGSVRSERLLTSGSEIYDSGPVENRPQDPFFTVRYFTGRKGRQPHPSVEKSRPALHQLLNHEQVTKSDRDSIQSCIRALSNTQRIDPVPALLREYSQAPSVRRMGERGENFAALVRTILRDERSRAAYVSWLQRLTPTEVDDVTVLSGALGEALFALKERGVDYPAPILSDGTLRFAAIAAAFFQPDMPNLLTIEEIENAIHPTRLRLLVELLKSQAQPDRQIMATTHSPIVLSWLKESDYRTTFFCKRNDLTGASEITPLSKVPRLLEVAKKQPVGDLFAEGWLEGAL
jgi:predicted ATPase